MSFMQCLSESDVQFAEEEYRFGSLKGNEVDTCISSINIKTFFKKIK